MYFLGDDLENFPSDYVITRSKANDYVRNLNPPGSMSHQNDTDKTKWTEQMQLTSTFSDKLKLKTGKFSTYLSQYHPVSSFQNIFTCI